MSKFAEPSYKILEEYLDILKSPRTGTDNSYLLGSKKTIVSKGGNDTILYQKTSEGEMVAHRFLIQSITDNYFKFQYRDKISTYSGASDLVMGEEIYFRKDSYFHEWLRVNIDDYENFVNTNKTFIYFGKIYPVSNEVNTYNIIFEGLKDFAINALPEHNQTDKIKELFKIFFDSVYHDIYNMTKTLWSFFDAKEVNIKHLDYLASRAGIDTDKDKVSELPLREFVDNLIYWLKRKGTYTSYYIIYKLLLKNTKNKLNFYERWVEWCLRTKRKDQNWISDFDFEDHHILEYYGVQPSGGAGTLYYDDYHPGNYPVRHTDVASDCSTGAAPIFIDRGNTNHKIVGHGGVSLDSDVKKFGNYGIKFDGTVLDYISVANHSDWDIQTNYSIDLWVKHTDHVGSEVYVSQYEDINNYWVLYHSDAWHGIYFVVMRLGVVIINTPSPINGEIIDTNKHHILMAKKGIEYGIYLDGNQVSYRKVAGMATFTGPLNIGLRGVWGYFDGHMDDVCIYHGNLFNASPNSDLTNTITVPTGPHISDSKTKLLLPGSPKGVLSPHYKVEIDLSSEPLGEDYIIDKNTIDELIRYWDYIKPVSKFIHYHMLLSPTGKIDGNNESVSLYDSKYTAICDTRFTGTTTITAASAATDYEDLYDETETFVENVSQSTWTINHSLESSEILIQAYDSGNNIIYPQSTNFISEDVLKLDWYGAVRGKAYLAGMKTEGNISTAYYNTSGASAWNIVHTASPSGIVYQVYFTKIRKNLWWPDTTDTGVLPNAYKVFDPVDCTGLTKANGTLIIDLKCSDWSKRSGDSQLEITSSASCDVEEWYLDTLALDITSEWKTFNLPLITSVTAGGELVVNQIDYIRWYAHFSEPETISWRGAKIHYGGGEQDERLVPESAIRENDSTLLLNFDGTPSGSVFIRNSDYYHIQNTASVKWIINHNMNIRGAIIQCWDNNNYRVYPENIQKINSNKHEVTFSEPVSGYAALIAFEREFREADVVKAAYWKIGDGATDDFNPVLSNDLNSWSASGELSSFTDTALGIDGYHIIEFNVPKENVYTLNEMGIFDSKYNMMYYTTCSTLYKPENVQLDVVYRIKKQEDST